MPGCILVDFKKSEAVVPQILDAVSLEGFILRGVRLVPSANQTRQSLQLDLQGCRPGPQLEALEQRLRSVPQVTDVIHWSNASS